MANYTFSQDLVNDILFKCGEPVDGTSDFDSQALEYLNDAYQGVWTGGRELDPNINENWWWLRKDDQGVLTLDPVRDAGTVAFTNGSNSITFSSAPSFSVSGWHIKADEHADVFIISDHTASGAAATLESVYTGETAATASFKCMHLDYALATDLIYLRGPMQVFQQTAVHKNEVHLTDLHTMGQEWPLNEIGSGVPDSFAMLTERSVRFSHFGGVSAGDYIKVNYEYGYEPADLTDSGSETPLVPRQYRSILANWGTGLLMLVKEDTRAKEYIALAKSGLRAMARENRRRMSQGAGGRYAKYLPRQGKVKSRRGPLRTETGVIIG